MTPEEIEAPKDELPAAGACCCTPGNGIDKRKVSREPPYSTTRFPVTLPEPWLNCASTLKVPGRFPPLSVNTFTGNTVEPENPGRSAVRISNSGTRRTSNVAGAAAVFVFSVGNGRSRPIGNLDAAAAILLLNSSNIVR